MSLVLPRTATALAAVTAVLPIALPARARGKTDISLRFTPIGDSDWQIDDVYLDPRLRG
jgi:hypothetical protein